MAFAAAARRSLVSRLSGHLAHRRHPALSHLLPSHTTGDPRKSSPLPSPHAPRSFHFPLAQLSGSGTTQTIDLLPFGLSHAGAPHRRFSSPAYPSRDVGFSDVLVDAADAVAPSAVAPTSFPGEVALAAEGSSYAVAAVQHLIDAVHSFTGFNWWLSIALSTVLLRGVVSACRLNVIIMYRDYFRVLQQGFSTASELINNAKDEISRKEVARQQFERLCALTRLDPVLFIPATLQGFTFITLYIAISNMVEKVPSLRGGGAFWFTDLTTPDALYIFPMITTLLFFLNLELRRRKKSQVKNAHRVLILLASPLTLSLPEAILGYLVSWSLGSLAETFVLAHPSVRKLIGAPTKTCSSSDVPKG